MLIFVRVLTITAIWFCWIFVLIIPQYVKINKVNAATLSKDLVPMTSRAGQSCATYKTVSVGNSLATVEWTVGGAMTVDDTRIFYALWSEIPPSAGLNCNPNTQPSLSAVQQHMKEGSVIGATAGTGQFSPKGVATTFSADIDVSQFAPGDKLAVIAAARVDSTWADKVTEAFPKINPQGHIALARTDPTYTQKNGAGLVIQGRLYWFSEPLTIVVG